LSGRPWLSGCSSLEEKLAEVIMNTRWLIRLSIVAALAADVAGCGSKSPAEPSVPCTYSLSSTSLSFGASGGTDSVTVTTGASCSWTAVSDRGWMSIASGGTGTGSGSVAVSLTANPTDIVRTGTLTIAGQQVAVREEGLAACTIAITPESASFNLAGGNGRVDVSAPAHCQWTVTSAASWVVVTSGGQGAGAAAVAYTVDRNRETATRSATIAIGDRTFRVTQGGDPGACEYAVSPVSFTPCMSVSYELTATVTTQDGCAWNANPDVSWITMTGGTSGSGTGIVRFVVGDNWERPRQGIVQVRWPTVTAGQNLHVAQAGCLYAVSTHAVSIASAGGTGRFDVFQQSEPNTCGGPLQDACRWTAQAEVPWITITTTMPQRGDNPVSFTVSPNPGPAVRVGSIIVRDQVVTVTQAGS
jgi:hypothetical protein